MINRIFNRSNQIVFSDGVCVLSEHKCLTVTFRDLSERMKGGLLTLGYSPPLELGSDYFIKKKGRLIGGETVCYCKHLFFASYEVTNNEY